MNKQLDTATYIKVITVWGGELDRGRILDATVSKAHSIRRHVHADTSTTNVTAQMVGVLVAHDVLS